MKRYGLLSFACLAFFLFPNISLADSITEIFFADTTTGSTQNYGCFAQREVGVTIKNLASNRTIEAANFFIELTGFGPTVPIFVRIADADGSGFPTTIIGSTTPISVGNLQFGEINRFSFPLNNFPLLTAGSDYVVFMQMVNPTGCTSNPYKRKITTDTVPNFGQYARQNNVRQSTAADTFFSWVFIEEPQSITISSPVDGSQINSFETPLNIDFVNPDGQTQINLCVVDPSVNSGANNPCEEGGQAFLITGTSGSILRTYTVSATATRVFYASFGTSFDFIPTGIQGVDFDKSSVGFFTASVDSTATSTSGGIDPFLGLECGGFNLVDNTKCSFIFLFFPTRSIGDRFAEINLGSTTPFDFIFDIGRFYSIMRNSVGTTTVLEANVFGATNTVFNNQDIGEYIGEDNATRVRFIIGFAAYLLVLFVIFFEVYNWFINSKN